ncbi:MAG: hypothetical protein K9N46_02025 [Candidatus Marinimicrobia bacterium]|nr:hypothetical protein [Candidatus Neomarinimicrobiota bacterium]MCF7828325.1 hypothetical protein [Candidatus Neomarinimicrobiota bacterium]MCF7879500.1 hypothetical protein [Candidatus Neomarinimicrobiota bacterium]
MKGKARTQNAMKFLGGFMFFFNGIAFLLMMFIYMKETLDFFWGPTGHFIYLGAVLIADTILSAIVYILPQNWSQQD